MNEEPTSRKKPSPRFAGLRPKLVALLVSTIAVLLVAEIVVRVLFHEELDTELKRKQNRGLSIGNLIEPSEIAEQLYRLKRGILEEWMSVIVATRDDIHSRISTYAPPPQNPAVRIALIGDSSSFGYRIFYEGSYAFALRLSLEKALGVPVELRNYSAPGYNSIQERITLGQVLAEWNPDLAILHYDHNDPNPQSAAPPGYIPPEYGDNILGSSLIKLTMRRLRIQRNQGLRIFVGDDGSEEWLFGSLRSGGTLYDAHLEELRLMGRALSERDIPAVAVIFEHGIERVGESDKDYHYDTLHAPLVPILENAGFHVLDLQPKYQELMRRSDWKDLKAFWVSDVDSHPNAFGHAFIAEHLHHFLMETPVFRQRLDGAAAKPGAGALDLAQTEAAFAFQRGLVMISRNDADGAKSNLEQALAFRPGDVSLRMNLAKIHVHENDIGNAVIQLAEAVSLKPDLFIAHVQLAQLYALMGKLDDALRHRDIIHRDAGHDDFKTAVDKRVADVLLKVATAYVESGEPSKALQILDRAAEVFRLAGREADAMELRGPLSR